MDNPTPGTLSWRLSAHPITLLFFLGFRIASLLVYLFGLIFIRSFILVFIITILLLSADFYFLKNIAGRRLVGLRWWNEVEPSGDSHWVFESSDPNTREVNKTDERFFWLAVYAQPALWVALAILALVRLENPVWLSLVVIALVLTLTNTVAFSRCDKFSQATNIASTAFYSGGLAKTVANGFFSRIFGR
ncbi:MAG: Golgi apparatus membrane protein tvp23 [Cirrosporium novae-zelandiae]|nr:MAG: Golgi apparatus membrane protein tvp23 [Cirrosporium novae-zelandiae]